MDNDDVKQRAEGRSELSREEKEVLKRKYLEELEAEHLEKQAYEERRSKDKEYSDRYGGRGYDDGYSDRHRHHGIDLGRYAGTEMESFVKENRDKVERLIKDERAHAASFIVSERDIYTDAVMRERIRARERVREEYHMNRAFLEEDAQWAKDRTTEAKEKMDEIAGKAVGTLTDAEVQQHLFGAGMEMFMAVNSLIKAAPVPDSVKEAINRTERNKDAEYCKKNSHCNARNQHKEKKHDDVERIHITDSDVKKKLDDSESVKIPVSTDKGTEDQ